MGRLKVFQMGTPWGGTRVIATTTKKQAAFEMGASLYEFNQYGGETDHKESVEAALASPGQLLIQRRRDDPFVPCARNDIGRPQ